MDDGREDAAEPSGRETVATALLRFFKYQVYQVRSAAEAMPEDKYSYRPGGGSFEGQKPGFGPAEMRSFAEQVEHVACSNFTFAAEFDSETPPEQRHVGESSSAKTKSELLADLCGSFAAVERSLAATSEKNMLEPVEGRPTTRLTLATVVVWHAADHYGQMVVYLRLNGIVPPSSRPNPPQLPDT